MKTLGQGTPSVPTFRSMQDCNTLQERYYRSLCDCEVKTDRWYIATIASICTTFICLPCILVVVYCYLMARKSKKGGKQ